MVVRDLNIGNKAQTLLQLSRKYAVPIFYTLSVEQIKIILKKNDIFEKDLVKAYNGSLKDRLELSRKIQKGKLDLELGFLNSLNRQLIIRSSAVGEDGEKFSFAGIYESATCNNEKKLVTTKIMFLISRAFSERVHSYSKSIGLNKFPDLALFIQNYITPEYGGVAFTSTNQNGKNGILLNIVDGSLEKAVTGRDISSYFISRNGHIDGNSKYSDKKIKEIADTLRKIEEDLKEPQDVEWCVSQGKIYILQSRKITKNIDDDTKIYDNSNIAESYSGIVLPLTCSFVKLLYARVYRDVARTSNIHPRKIKENDEVFDNLIVFVNGRIYYDILNWYKMLTLFPGYDRNRRNLDDMISIRSKAELDSCYRRNVHFMDKLRYYPFIAYRVFRFEHDLKNFKKHVNQYQKKIKDINLEGKSVNELLAHFEEFKKELLNRWSITVDNDFLAMTWFGIYKKHCLKLKLQNSELMENISSMNSVISADQVRNIANVSKIFNQNKHLVFLAKNQRWNECYEALISNDNIRTEINKYLEVYGGRFANELKLESQDIESDPKFLVELLYSYKDVKLNNFTKNKQKSTRKSMALRYLASRTKHYLKNREELRLLRSKAFSHARKIFVNLGKKLAKEGKLKRLEDIFYLELKEIKFNKRTHKLNFKTIIAQRKKDYEIYSKISMPNIVIMKNNEIQNRNLDEEHQDNAITRGIGCSSGIVEGKITILNKFFIPKKQLDIVVVKNTDPGWTPLFGLCKGLIVENGGLLSHAAIISRELGLPCIIGVKDATRIFRKGQSVKMNGNTGEIRFK